MWKVKGQKKEERDQGNYVVKGKKQETRDRKYVARGRKKVRWSEVEKVGNVNGSKKMEKEINET